MTRTGQVRWCASTWEPLRDEPGRQVGYLGTEFDITERKLAEEEMRLDTELFQAVIEVQQAVAAAGLDSRHGHAGDRRAEPGRSPAPRAWSSRRIEGDELVPQVHIGTESPRLRLADSLSGALRPNRRAAALRRHAADPRIGHEAYRAHGIRSLLAVPLRDEQRTLGVLKVFPPGRRAFSDRDAKALRLLGGLMGRPLGHAAAFESAAAPAGGPDQRPAGERAAVQAAGGRGAGGHLARRRAGSHHLRQPAHGPAARLPERRACWAARSTTSSRPARAPAPSARWRGRPRAARAATSASAARTAASSGAWSRPARSWAATAPRRHGRHGHRHHRAEAHRGAAAPLRRAARHAARHGTGDPRRALAGRDRSRRAGADPPAGALPALHASCSSTSPRGQAQLDRGLHRRAAAFRRADSARPPSRPARCSVAAPSATSRTSARWNRRRRSSGSCCEEGHPQRAHASRSWWTARPSAR